MKSHTKCKHCGRPIQFVKTPAGGHMPCDGKAVYYYPADNGPHRIVTGDGYVVRGEILDKPTQAALVGLVPHWATCTNPKRAKKVRGRPTKTLAAAQSGKIT